MVVVHIGIIESIGLKGGVLKYKWMSGIDRWLLVVPEILNGTVLEFCHSKGVAGHMGIDRTSWSGGRILA